MAKNQFEWDYAAAGNLLLKSDEIASICEREAEKMTRATGMKYVPDVRVGSTRVRAAGFQEQGKTDGEEFVCPKCGVSHPNCRCSRRGR